MRITSSLFYQNAKNDNQKSLQSLYDVNAQMSSGMKIQNSYEDSGIFVDTMRLNYEVATLEQVKETSSKAQTFANNTDTTLNQFTDTLVDFRTTLLQAANSSNSPTSLEALADELEALKNHLITLGNTSINGQYLFSGTAFSTQPLNDDGTYNGNAENIEAIIGSNVQLPYNITGQDLFLGKDTDYNKIVSTNVQMYNQTLLYPSQMGGDGTSEEVYLKETDTIRDMVGDISTSDSGYITSFYISGRDTQGDTFSQEVQLDSTSKVSDLLESIGKLYGNTSTNEVVEVSMNDYGQIEIKDLTQGNALIEFNIFGAVDRNGGSDASQSNIDDLLAYNNVDIIEFSRSNFLNQNTASTISSNQDIYSPGTFKLGAPMSLGDGAFVDGDTKLQDFMGNIDQLQFSGEDNDGNNVPVPPNDTLSVDSTTTVQNFLDEIETIYGVSARIEDGQIYLESDLDRTYIENQLSVKVDALFDAGEGEVQSITVSDTTSLGTISLDFDGTATPFDIELTTEDFPTADYPGGVIPASEVASFIANSFDDLVPFDNVASVTADGNNVVVDYVTSAGDVANVGITTNTTGAVVSVSQSVAYTAPGATGGSVNAFATFDSMNYERRGFEKDGNQLSSNVSQIVKETNEYATNSTKLLEVSGIDTLNGEQMIFEGVDKDDTPFSVQIDFATTGSTFSLDGGVTNYDIFDGDGNVANSDEMSYQQLMDVISMVTSGVLPTDTDSSSTIEFSEYNDAIKTAQNNVEVNLDYKGRVEILDTTKSVSDIEFAMYDANADDVGTPSALNFMSNNAMTIDEPYIDIFSDLDDMIEAVRNGTNSIDGTNSANPRNLGIENSLLRLDHISDHVTKQHAVIGAYSNALSNAQERVELLSVNVQTVQSEIIGVDTAEAYLKYQQLSISYQATLSTISKINSMSLLNYM